MRRRKNRGELPRGEVRRTRTFFPRKAKPLPLRGVRLAKALLELSLIGLTGKMCGSGLARVPHRRGQN
jgi:hypothetical protein